ncbi:hypothetical protein [Prosthecobacter sp.]|uniref:hypothetical protein n=1 Tax=Prosthecobacter sp. TaxID=1965333 RepID=UPI003783484C
MNTSVTPEKVEPPVTPPPLEPEKVPAVIRDRKASDTQQSVDKAAGDEGIDDAQDGAATSAEDLEDHEEDLGEE